MARPISFEQAKRKYVNRYTMEHKPSWAYAKRPDGVHYYAPQYASDKEWYDNTQFPGEGIVLKTDDHCLSQNPTWPVGRDIKKPFHV